MSTHQEVLLEECKNLIKHLQEQIRILRIENDELRDLLNFQQNKEYDC